MWNESETVRIGKVLAHNGISGEALLKKFRTAAREDVRLAAALRGFFLDSSDENQKEEYFSYLSRRIRPAVSALIESNRVVDLAVLAEKNLFTAELTDAFLAEAIAMNRSEITVWFLQMKGQKFGFPDRDFGL